MFYFLHGPKEQECDSVDDELEANVPLASENMDIFSCLQSRDLPCDSMMDSRNYQYGVEAYNPQLGCPQRRRSSGRVSVPLGPAPKTANLSRTRESRTAPFALPYSDSDLPGPSPAPIPVVGVHDAEIVDVDKVDPLPVSPLREELGCRGILSETVAPAETECPLVIGEVRLEETTCGEGPLEEVLVEDPAKVVIEVLAPAVESMDFERESSVPDLKETEMPETESMMPEPMVDPVDRTEASQDSGSSRAEKSEVPTMSKERAKLILAKWVTLSTDERVGDEQKSKVCDTLDVLSPSYPNFASSFKTAKLDLLALTDKFQHSGAAQFPDDEAQLEAELA
ncbi:unnamed protein product [Prunus armeniaca]|uniref:Uncharacterized protein n=1 Tax=Prunus armeniaca TaxID=36596 RepID=A0A6J5VDL9_PRUAR|nr:unnamed protein product [Prunus armeniaca]